MTQFSIIFFISIYLIRSQAQNQSLTPYITHKNAIFLHQKTQNSNMGIIA